MPNPFDDLSDQEKQARMNALTQMSANNSTASDAPSSANITAPPPSFLDPQDQKPLDSGLSDQDKQAAADFTNGDAQTQLQNQQHEHAMAALNKIKGMSTDEAQQKGLLLAGTVAAPSNLGFAFARGAAPVAEAAAAEARPALQAALQSKQKLLQSATENLNKAEESFGAWHPQTQKLMRLVNKLKFGE